MTTEDAKTYLSKRDIPRLFESLMTGLMYHRPQDHIKYLIDCLQKVHDKGQADITWSSFVDIRRTKTPLPPITNGTARPSSKGSRPSSRTKTPKEEKTPREKISSPLPAIPTSTTPEKVSLPDIPVVIVMGSPGSGKDSQVGKLLTRYPGWHHLNVGKLIKEEIQRRGEAHTKWKMTRDLLSRGEVAPEEVTIEVLLEGIKKASSAKGIVITGYPRNMEQVGDYAKFVSRIDVVFMIDCEESKAMDKLLRKGRTSNKPEHSMSAITTKMNYFKANSLPSAKFYDDQGKLVIIEGDADDDMVQYKFGQAFDKLFFKQHGSHPQQAEPPKSAGSNLPEPATYSKRYEDEEGKTGEKEESFVADEEEKAMFTGPVPLPPVISEQDTGRKPDLPTCPIIFVAGGPGSGKGTQCQRIIQRYPGFVHLSMGDIIRSEISTKGTADDKWGMISTLVSKGEMAPEEVTIDLLKEQLKKNSSAKAFIIEGFPRDKSQVEAFNKHIGGLNFVILFDCEEYYMQTRLLKRGRESGRVDDNPSAIASRLNFYKYNTLPVMKHFDDEGKLVVRNIADLDADRDMETMFFDISQMFDFAFFGRKPGDEVYTLDEKQKAALLIKASFQGYKLRNKQKSNKLPTTDDDKLKAKRKVASTTEVMANNLDDEMAKAALRIRAAFEGGKKRQQKVLRQGASYSGKYDSRKQSHKSETKIPSEETKRAADQISAAFAGYKKKFNRDEKKTDVKQDKKEEAKAPEQDEVVEETITQDTAKTTGDTVENPSHTQKLDEAAES